MNADMKAAKRSLMSTTNRPELPDERIGSIVQVFARTVIDDDGNTAKAKIEVDREAFIEKLRTDGSPLAHLELVPKTKSPHAALRAAVTRSKQGLKETGDQREQNDGMRFMWRRLGVHEDVVSYALVVARPNAKTKKWEGSQVATVSVGKTGGIKEEWNDTGYATGPAGKLVDDVSARYDAERLMLHSDDVRKWINLVLDSTRSVHLGGMLHLVPVANDESFVAAERALQYAGYTTFVQPIDSAGHVAENVRGGLLSEVAALAREIKDLATQQRDPREKDVRLATFTARMDKVQSIGARANMFQDLVGPVLEDVHAAVNDADNLLRDVMLEMVS